MREFISYIGPPELHDSCIISIEQSDNRVVVHIRAYEGHNILLEFMNVTEVKSVRAAGMLLFALAEYATDESARWFVFVNWQEEDEARLEIKAQEFQVINNSE